MEAEAEASGPRHQGKASLEEVVLGQAAQLVHNCIYNCINLHSSTQFNKKNIFWRLTFQTDPYMIHVLQPTSDVATKSSEVRAKMQ